MDGGAGSPSPPLPVAYRQAKADKLPLSPEQVVHMVPTLEAFCLGNRKTSVAPSCWPCLIGRLTFPQKTGFADIKVPGIGSGRVASTLPSLLWCGQQALHGSVGVIPPMPPGSWGLGSQKMRLQGSLATVECEIMWETCCPTVTHLTKMFQNFLIRLCIMGNVLRLFLIEVTEATTSTTNQPSQVKLTQGKHKTCWLTWLESPNMFQA